MEKKKTPLIVWETLQPFLDLQSKHFVRVPDDKVLLRYRETDPHSDFFFVVKEYRIKQESVAFKIDHAPNTVRNANSHEYEVSGSQLGKHIENWSNLLNRYAEVRTPHDDTIADAYTKEYFDQYTIIDEDAHVKPYPTKVVLLLEQFLTDVENEIDEFKNENNKEGIDQIKQEASILKDNLTTQPKSTVFKNLMQLLGKITRNSWNAGKKFAGTKAKELFSEIGKELTKRAAKALIDGATSLPETIEKISNLGN
jgi:hypothetical protein